MKEEDNGLQELIKDLECIAASNHERLKKSLENSQSVSLHEFYKEGYKEGITLAALLARSYLKKDPDET